VIPNRCLAALLCSALLLGGCGTAADLANSIDDGPQVAPEKLQLEATYGIKVEGLRLSAAGSMLDFRYRVVDASKASAMLDGRIQPYLFDAARGAKLGVPDTPVLGRIRQTARNNKILTNRTYFIMFGNPAKVLQSGDKVTLLLGSVKVSDLTVQ
jgi:hypothetical protein